jgi:hypothetical protein
MLLWFVLDFDPKSIDLEKLFRDPDMFDSRDDWHDAGFEVLSRSSDSKIMVASHEAVNGVLFKKYAIEISLKEQIKNYARRIDGARRLKKFIEERELEHVVVPQKWLCELSREFGSDRRKSHVLVVERLDILDEDKTIRKYYDIDEDVLEELCIVFSAFRGLDSTANNVPFTADGKIAFIDTEHWYRRRKKRRRGSKKPFFRHLDKHLSRSRLALAEEIFEELEEDDDEDEDAEDDED